MKPHPSAPRFSKFDDFLLISLMAVLAACGLIYEYLLSHYAGRVLGSVETAIYSMIGLMIVAMGVGAFLARQFTQPFAAFAWLEASIALLGMSAILVIAVLLALTQQLPQLLQQILNIPWERFSYSWNTEQLYQSMRYSTYVIGALLGLMIGMEIPLIATIRQQLHQAYLPHNAGTLYGADYIGAGIGAGIWVWLLLSLDLTQAAVLTASLNVIVGLIFLWRFHHYIPQFKRLLAFHLLITILLFVFAQFGQLWMQQLTHWLYKDKVIYSAQTPFQHIAITERTVHSAHPPILDLYLNGRLQFSSIDEHIYHSLLVHPALISTPQQKQVLIIGGGDGLALREVLRWQPEEVVLIDLDPQLVSLFTIDEIQKTEEDNLRQRLSQLNGQAFSHSSVEVIYGDAFVNIDPLIQQQRYFDSIIVDLPDPSHPDLNKMYSRYFYQQLKRLLKADGTLAIQSTSPFHAHQAFLSIGKTVHAAGFADTTQYRANIPSFGEWGFTLATKQGLSPIQRIQQQPFPDFIPWLTQEVLLASFHFPQHFYRHIEQIKINTLGSGQLFKYHHQAWQQQQGIYDLSIAK